MMERATIMVKDVTPTTSRPWTVKVKVVDKTSPRDARNSPKKFQRLVLADEKDNRVQLTLFGDSIAMFSDRLEMYGTYYISNANVQPALPQYRIGDNCYQWSLHSKCLVEEVEKDATPIAVPDSFFTPIERLPDYKDSGILIDVLVVAIAMLPIRSVNTKTGPTNLQEIIVIDKSLCPVILTLWGHFVSKEATDIAAIIDQRPLLAAHHVQISSYNGLAITSRGLSTFYVQPPTDAAVTLRAWLHSNIALVDALANNSELVSMAKAFGQVFTKEYIPLSIVKTKSRTRLFYVNCHLKMSPNKQELLTKKCSDCGRPTSAAVAAVYTCNFCKKQSVVCVPGLRAEVIAFDASGQLPITLYDNDVAVFFRCDYDSLLKSQLQEKPESSLTFDNSDPRLEVNLQLKAYDNFYMGVNTRKFSGSFVSSISDSDTSMNLPEIASATAALDSLEAVHDLTPAEKELLHNIRRRFENNPSSVPFAAGSTTHATTSMSNTSLSNSASAQHDYVCTISKESQGLNSVTVEASKISSLDDSNIDLAHSTAVDNDLGTPAITEKTFGRKRTLRSDSNLQPVRRELFPPHV